MEQDTGSGVDPAELTEAELTEAELAGAELAGAELAEADLAEADLAEADLADAVSNERQVDTGEPRVDGAIRQLRELDELPVSEHPQVFERIHGQLVDVLGELHSGSGTGTGAGSGTGSGTGQADQAAR